MVVSFLTNCGLGVIQFVVERKIANDLAAGAGAGPASGGTGRAGGGVVSVDRGLRGSTARSSLLHFGSVSELRISAVIEGALFPADEPDAFDDFFARNADDPGVADLHAALYGPTSSQEQYNPQTLFGLGSGPGAFPSVDGAPQASGQAGVPAAAKDLASGMGPGGGHEKSEPTAHRVL